MKKNSLFIAFVAVLAALLFTLVTYYNGIINEHEIQHSKQTNSIVRLEDKLMKQVSAIRYTLPDSTWVYNKRKERIRLASIAEEEPRIGLYIDRYQCESCWQAELGSLTHYLKKETDLPAPIILAANYNIREIKLLAQRNNTSVPMYITEEIAALQHIGRVRKPFFFILEPGGVIASVYYPDEQSVESDSIYFSTIARQYRKKAIARHPATKKGFHILQERIDIGTIGLRKKKEVVFKLENNSDKPCDIHDIRMSCTCMMLKTMPQRILPGETGEIRIDILSLSKGPFNRTLQLTTSCSEEPYILAIQGNVV